MPDTFALESEDIRKTFGHFTALAGVTLGVKRGEFLALFGRNGAGKTTFLKIAATLVPQSQGKLRVEGIDTRQEPERARRHIGLRSRDLEQGVRGATRAAISDRGKIVFDSGAKDPASRDAYSAYIRPGVGR